MTVLQTAAQVIDALGGTTATTHLTKRRHVQSVTNWRRNGRLPANTYPVIRAALKKRGLKAPLSVWGIQEAD